MKKSILIGVLAALMLVAFTACDNSAPQTPLMGNQIEGVELVSAPDYLVGIDSVIDPAEIKLNVVKNDGTKIPYTGKELGIGTDVIKSTMNAVPVKYGTFTSYVNIPAYSVEAVNINVTGLVQTTVEKDASAKISLEGVAVSYVYDGTKERKVDADLMKDAEISATDLGFKADEAELKETFTVKAADIKKAIESGQSSFSSETAVNVTGDISLTVVEKEKLAITNVVLKQVYSYVDNSTPASPQTVNKEVFYVGDKNTYADVAIEGTITLSNGTTEDFTYYTGASDVTLTDKDAEAATDYPAVSTLADGVTYKIILQEVKTTKEFTSASPVAVQAVVARTEDGDTIKSAATTLNLKAIEDYPTAFETPTVAQENGKDVKETWTIGDAIDPDDFVFVVDAWASLNEYDEGKEPKLTGSWTSDPEKIRENTEANKAYPVTFTYKGYHGEVNPNAVVEATGATIEVVKG